MSWLFSRALVEEYSAANCLGGEPYAQLNVMPTPHKFWHNGKTMDASSLSRFGLTCAALTEPLGEELLMSYLAGFRAKTFQQPDEGQESTASVPASGARWRELSVRYDRDSCSWKTRHSLLEEDLPAFSPTLPKWGSMRSGELLERTTLPPLTSAKGSGLWPTPMAHRGTNRRTKPTPAQAAGKAGMQLGGLLGGTPNPDWSEWLMGWSISWTDLKQSATDKYRLWLRLHGGF